ncbi:hypothetical protein [Maridesulfovibrio sp.]|uniref:hypothetical protein n=1 Tax=Maridesulfovibrio sp. TaxID=2795000 RepID=UPI002A186EFF|nr:hypothetical protein [Maridesulfovibrio sp.]
MPIRQFAPETATLRTKTIVILMLTAAILLLPVSPVAAAIPYKNITKNQAPNSNESFSLNFSINNNTEIIEADILQPRLAPIPNKEKVNPQKADEIRPSKELKEIIERVKNGTLPTHTNKTDTEIDYSVSREDLAIIKSGGKAVKAGEVEPSPALKAVLEAYRSGKIDYTQRDIREVEEEMFYHQPYAEMNMASVYDLILLQTGRDVFLSLDYQQLSKKDTTVEQQKSRRIKDLQQTITAIKIKDKQKQDKETNNHEEKLNKAHVKIKIKPKETFVRRMLNLFGIRRKDETVDYESLSKTYRAYKRWDEHVKSVDDILRRKRKRKIQLIQQRLYRPSQRLDCSDPAFRGACPDGQLKIDPYKNGNIRFLRP